MFSFHDLSIGFLVGLIYRGGFGANLEEPLTCGDFNGATFPGEILLAWALIQLSLCFLLEALSCLSSSMPFLDQCPFLPACFCELICEITSSSAREDLGDLPLAESGLFSVLPNKCLVGL